MTRYTVPDPLFGYLLLAALLGLKLVIIPHIAWAKDQTFTQTTRYAFLVFGFVVCLPAALAPIIAYGLNDTAYALTHMRSTIPMFGWSITIGYFCCWFTVLVTPITWFRVTRTPALISYTFWGHKMVVRRMPEEQYHLLLDRAYLVDA